MLGLGLGLTSRGALQAHGSAAVSGIYTGAAIDLDFVAQRYYWDGALKTTADFTTYTLNGSTFDATGLTPSATIDVTVSLSGLGTFIPGALAGAVTITGAPAASKVYFELDDGTNNDRLGLIQNVTPVLLLSVVDNNVSQANVNAGAGALTVRHGFAGSYATAPPGDMKAAGDGVAATADTVGTMPTVTTLRIGKLATTTGGPSGAVARVVFFTSVKTQAELNALSVALRDNVVI